ncbi:MAG: hypothetical protein OEO82_07605 [Gammaproteobacteria bacterium]|nr:hypothetical protein [Gammaproteobacteria bacterium]
MFTRNAFWKFCCGIVIGLAALAFSPLVLAPGRHTPELFGMPRTLWLGILLAFALVAMTLIGGIVHPANDAQRDPSRDGNC